MENWNFIYMIFHGSKTTALKGVHYTASYVHTLTFTYTHRKPNARKETQCTSYRRLSGPQDKPRRKRIHIYIYRTHTNICINRKNCICSTLRLNVRTVIVSYKKMYNLFHVISIIDSCVDVKETGLYLYVQLGS